MFHLISIFINCAGQVMILKLCIRCVHLGSLTSWDVLRCDECTNGMWVGVKEVRRGVNNEVEHYVQTLWNKKRFHLPMLNLILFDFM